MCSLRNSSSLCVGFHHLLFHARALAMAWLTFQFFLARSQMVCLDVIFPPDARVSSPGTSWCRPAHPPPGHSSFRPCGKRWPWRRRMAHRRRSDGAAWTAACTVTYTRWPCQARGRTKTKKTRMEACDVRDAPEIRLGPIHSRWMGSKNARVRASKGKRT